MQEHNKIQLYVGLEEGGCIDVGAINLVGFTLIETSELQDLKAERDVLAAQVEALQAHRKELLDLIYNCAIGQVAMGYVFDAETLAQSAYSITGIDAASNKKPEDLKP